MINNIMSANPMSHFRFLQICIDIVSNGISCCRYLQGEVDEKVEKSQGTADQVPKKGQRIFVTLAL
jgi:hypothetical protein